MIRRRREEGALRIDRTRTDGLVGVWFDADEANTERFLPGDTVKIEMSVGMDEVPVPAIPKACVFRDGLETAVFVRDEDDDDRYVLRHVRIGKSANGWTQVKDLPVGMEVVSTGAYELKTALATGEGASRIAGHFHADGKFHAGDAEDDE